MKNENSKQPDVEKRAFWYLKKGWSVIPVGINKQPLIKWKEFTKRLPTEEEIVFWWEQYPEANVAIITGKISGITVVDVEAGGDISLFPKTRTIRTGGGGYHLYYKHNSNINNAVRIRELTDIRNTGGYVIAPPSIHKSGKKYKLIEKLPLAEFPIHLFRQEPKRELYSVEKPVNSWDELFQGVEEGQRNDTAAKIAGLLFSKIPRELWSRAVLPTMKAWNKKNIPPLPKSELAAVYKSIRKYQGEKHNALFKPIPLSELLEKEEKTEWLVERLIPKVGITMLSGAPVSFKTWFMLHIAECVALGSKTFGHFETKRANVLVVDEESGWRLIKTRMQILQANPGTNVYFSSKQGFKVERTGQLDSLLKFVEEYQIGLVCFDSLVRFHSKEENAANQMAEVFESFNKLTKKEVTVLILHHHRKETGAHIGTQSMRGSSDILAAVDSHLMTQRMDNEKNLKVIQNKSRYDEELKPFNVQIVTDDDKKSIRFEYDGEATEREYKKDAAKSLIVLHLKKGNMSRQELLNALKNNDIGREKVDEALRDLESEGEITKTRGAKNKITYRVKDSQIKAIDEDG